MKLDTNRHVHFVIFIGANSICVPVHLPALPAMIEQLRDSIKSGSDGLFEIKSIDDAAGSHAVRIKYVTGWACYEIKKSPVERLVDAAEKQSGEGDEWRDKP